MAHSEVCDVAMAEPNLSGMPQTGLTSGMPKPSLDDEREKMRSTYLLYARFLEVEYDPETVNDLFIQCNKHHHNVLVGKLIAINLCDGKGRVYTVSEAHDEYPEPPDCVWDCHTGSADRCSCDNMCKYYWAYPEVIDWSDVVKFNVFSTQTFGSPETY
jgi:hypothetical protein